jgi:drug/metabolite transporter (DMT)-like permease
MALKKTAFGPKHLTKDPPLLTQASPLSTEALPLRPRLSRQRATIELFFAGALWGFGFIASKWGLLAFNPVEILVYRFFIGVIAGEFIHFAMYRSRLKVDLDDIKRALPAGALLSLFMLPQTIGLQYTTATNSGFLTTLYIILVPVLNHLFFKLKTRPRIYLAVVLALLGAFLLMGAHFDTLNKGDIVTMGCAVMGALHIIYLGRVSKHVKDVVRFNNWQTFFCLISVFPFLILQDHINFLVAPLLAWAGILFLGIGSSAIAFIFQVRAQSVLTFGYLLLGDRLSPLQLAGALVIMISSGLTILWDSPARSKTAS